MPTHQRPGRSTRIASALIPVRDGARGKFDLRLVETGKEPERLLATESLEVGRISPREPYVDFLLPDAQAGFAATFAALQTRG